MASAWWRVCGGQPQQTEWETSSAVALQGAELWLSDDVTRFGQATDRVVQGITPGVRTPFKKEEECETLCGKKYLYPMRCDKKAQNRLKILNLLSPTTTEDHVSQTITHDVTISRRLYPERPVR